MRGWMNEHPPVYRAGPDRRGDARGRDWPVIASRHGALHQGDVVRGMFGVQERAVSDGAARTRSPFRRGSPATHLGVLGMTGDHGVLRAARRRARSARRHSARVGRGRRRRLGRRSARQDRGGRAVGIAGGPRSADCSSRSSASTPRSTTSPATYGASSPPPHTPDGVDVFFDKSAARSSTLGLTRLARGARVVIAARSRSTTTLRRRTRPELTNMMAARRARDDVRLPRVRLLRSPFPEAVAEMSGWLRKDG